MDLKSCVGAVVVVAIVACLLVGWAGSKVSEASSAPTPPPRAEAKGLDAVEVALQRARMDFDRARELFSKGKLQEASVFAYRLLASRPANVEALDLYVKIQLATSDRKWRRGEHRGSLDACELAGRVADGAWNDLKNAPHIEPGAVDEVQKIRSRAKGKLVSTARTLITHAGKLYRAAKGSWYENDKEEWFIEAMVLLDAIKPDQIPARSRKEQASIWISCRSELGSHDFDMYKLRTSLVNGR